MLFSLNFILVIVQSILCVHAKYATTGVFTGINTSTGERPARRDILEMVNDVAAL